MNPKYLARIEQFRQARRIHGGTLNMWAVAAGVKLSRMPIPSRRLRERVYRTVYGQKYRALNEAELDRPLAEYRSLNELFTRGVRPACRPIPNSERQFLCPCDGTVQDVGRLEHDTLLTVKGTRYTLESLLPETDIARFRNGSFVVTFLSPADCHRVFAPAAGAIASMVHVPGRRLLVHPPYQRDEFPVFSLNERVILNLRTHLGECVLVMVAGWGVGNITHPFERRLRWSRRRRITRRDFPSPRTVQRGEWIGTFELGSTVILITEANGSVVTDISRDEQVVYGQPAFTFPTTQGQTPCKVY